MRGALIVGILLSILITVFALLNKVDVPVNYYFGKVELPLSFLLMITLALGILIMFLFNIPSWWKNRKEKTSLKKEIAELKSQVEQLNVAAPLNEPIIEDFINDVDTE